MTELGQLPGLAESLDTLVHESAAACPLTHARHAHFIRLHLLKPLFVSIAAPLVLALSGAPAPWQAAAFGLGMLPLAGVALASRRGALAEAQGIGLAALAGLACVAALAAGPGFGAALFLLLLPFEAALALSLRALVVSAAAAGLLAAVLMGASAAGFIPPAGSAPLADAAFGLCALVYALGLAHGWRADSQLRQALHERERAEHAALRALVGDASLTFNRAGAVLAAAGDCASALGLRARDLSGRGFFERVQVADRPLFLKALSEAGQPDGAGSVRLRLRCADVDSARGAFVEPAFRHVEIRARHLAGEGESAVVIALMRDVSDLVEADRLLAVKRAGSIEDSAWKDRLLANVSHELRTPLNAIIGFSDMLGAVRSASLSEAQQREYAGIINASGQHLLSIVNALLDMSKMEAGRFHIAVEPIELAPLIDSCCDILRLKAQESKIEILRDIQPDLGAFIADARACRQIVLNLMSNAIKFTPAGGRVTIAAKDEGETVVLSVADTGIGVNLADLPRLGDPFFQAPSAGGRPNEGAGLGLSVVKGLVGLHGGAISFESAPGQGACVTIRLPRHGGAPAQSLADGAEPATLTAPDSATIEIIPRRAAAPVPDVTMVKKIA